MKNSSLLNKEVQEWMSRDIHGNRFLSIHSTISYKHEMRLDTKIFQITIHHTECESVLHVAVHALTSNVHTLKRFLNKFNKTLQFYTSQQSGFLLSLLNPSHFSYSLFPSSISFFTEELSNNSWPTSILFYFSVLLSYSDNREGKQSEPQTTDSESFLETNIFWIAFC